MRLKEMYDTARSTSFPVVEKAIVDAIEVRIKVGHALPYYINDVDLSRVCKSYLMDVMLQKHGVVMSSHPNGIIVEELV